MSDQVSGQEYAGEENPSGHPVQLQRVVRSLIGIGAVATDRTAMLRDTCAALVECGLFEQAWVYLQEAGAGHRHAASTGATATFERMNAEVEAGRSPACLNAALQAYTVLRYGPDHMDCLQCGVRAAHDEGVVWAIPMRFGNRHFGALFALQRNDTLTHAETPTMLLDAGAAMAAGLHRLEQEAARQQAERRYERLVDNLMGMVYQCHNDEHWTMQFVSAGAFELTGYRPEELLANAGNQYGDIIHPEDRARVREEVDAALEKGESFVLRYRIVRADGSIRWVVERGNAVPNGGPESLRLEGIITDVTGQVEREEQLRESETRFRSLIEGAPEPVFVQLEGKFDYLNRAACTLFGVAAPEALIGQPVIERFHPDYRETVLRRIKQLNEERQPVPNLEERILRVDGFEVPVEVSAVPFQLEQRRGALVFMHDLTLRKRVEEKHRELEGQLQQAQKLESVGRLAGGIAHDFNNLLMPILGHAEMLASDLPRDDPAQEPLTEILAAAERARNVAGQLLAFSRKKPLEMKPVDLNAVVSGFQKLLGTLLGEDIAVSVKPAPEHLPILGDSAQLEQVLLNLAINARDAMPNGGRFRIETSAVEIGEEYIAERPLVAPGDYALLAVTDEGVGMDEATRTRIFDPFFTTKEHDKGTGLGLSNVYGIVKQHKGQIWVYSEPGHGTTFKVYIPLAGVAAHSAPPAPAEPEPQAAAPDRPARVLVLEDQHPVRLLVVRMLERMGHKPIEAATLAEARKHAKREDSIDLMISDVILPDGKGPDAYAELRNLHADMRIIFMSGYTEHVVLDNHIMSGRFLQKPFTAKSLSAAVTQILTGPMPPAS